MRWQHPERGVVPPNEFLPICEETGLIVPLGRWLLRDALAQIQRWREWFGTDLHLSLQPVGGGARPARPARAVGAALAGAGAEPATLCLEITEHALMTEASHCLENLDALDALGVELALDDFGTGYSSLAYLRKLPITILKIDRAFMTGTCSSRPTRRSSRRSSASPARSGSARSPRASRPTPSGPS